MLSSIITPSKELEQELNHGVFKIVHRHQALVYSVSRKQISYMVRFRTSSREGQALSMLSNTEL